MMVILKKVEEFREGSCVEERYERGKNAKSALISPPSKARDIHASSSESDDKLLLEEATSSGSSKKGT